MVVQFGPFTNLFTSLQCGSRTTLNNKLLAHVKAARVKRTVLLFIILRPFSLPARAKVALPNTVLQADGCQPSDPHRRRTDDKQRTTT